MQQLRSRLRPVITLNEPELIDLIPTQTGFIAVDCPNCEEGSQGSQLEWRIEEPSFLTCRYCRHRYPSSRYPDDRALEVRDPLGRPVRYPYYQDAGGRRYFFRARLARLARNYFMIACNELAELHALTGEAAPARKAAIILNRFAELYPGFLVTRESSQDDQGFQSEPPYQTQGGKWGRWYFDELPTPLFRAFDLILASGELERLGAELGLDVRLRIEDDFFRAAVRHVRTYPEYHANPSPRIYEGLAVLGRVIGEPGFVHDAVRRLRGMSETSFFFDGMWKEGTFGYHRMTLNGIELVLDALGGYSDPAGYVDAVDGRHFERLDMAAEVPNLARARTATGRLRYPDGRPLPVHDSWARLRGEYLREKPLDSSTPSLWPAMGHLYLGRGRGADQMQFHLHFSGGYGHAHNDSLNISLFACGEELLSDLGYSHTRYRYWTRSTFAHNTVAVDGREQHTGSEREPSDGNLRLFAPAGDSFQVAEAGGERAYPGRVRLFRRLVMLVGMDERNAYGVDLFRIAGGDRHEWVVHGSADFDQRLATNASLEPGATHLLPLGVTFRPPASEYDTGSAGGHNPAYGFIRGVRRGRADGVLVSTFEPLEATRPSLRIHTAPPAGSEVFVGRAPSIRRADESDARVDEVLMPILLLRRDGHGLAGSFLSVLEPFSDKPVIEHVERLDAGRGDAVRIDGGTWVDYIVCNPEGQGETVEIGKLRISGRVGWVRERGGEAVEMCLVGGRELAFGSRKIASFGTWVGRVTGVSRKARGAPADALEVAGSPPSVRDVRGLSTIVRHGDGSSHGYPLAGVRRVAGRTLLLLRDEPGFEVAAGGTRFLFFPRREIAGEVTCSVAAVARWKVS